MTAKRAWLTVAALLAAPVIGWCLGGLLVMVGLNAALKRFEQAEIEEAPAFDWKNQYTRIEAPSTPLDADELWRNAIADYREYDGDSPYGKGGYL